MLHDGGVEILFRGEMPKNDRLSHPRRCRDLFRGGSGKPFPCKEIDRDFDQLPPPFVGRQAMMRVRLIKGGYRHASSIVSKYLLTGNKKVWPRARAHAPKRVADRLFSGT